MNEISDFEAIPIGMEIGPFELVLDQDFVKQRTDHVQWVNLSAVTEMDWAPPGVTIAEHARMKFQALPKMKASIWAKSEHEFLKPMTIGTKITIRGRVVEKYVKRQKNYVVCEYETIDETGELLLKSRETGVYVE